MYNLYLKNETYDNGTVMIKDISPYTEEMIKNIYKGDKTKLFQNYDPKIHIIDKEFNYPIFDGGIIREMTDQEKINNGIIKQILIPTREDQIKSGVITIETEKEKIRYKRKEEFRLLDILDSKIGAKRIRLTDQEEIEIVQWYNTWKDLPEQYVDVNVEPETLYPPRPEKINYFADR